LSEYEARAGSQVRAVRFHLSGGCMATFSLTREAFSREAAELLSGKGTYGIAYRPLPTSILNLQSLRLLGMLLRDFTGVPVTGKAAGLGCIRCEGVGGPFQVIYLSAYRSDS